MPTYPIVIHSIHIAPAHRVFNAPPDTDLSGSDLVSLPVADCVAHAGIAGDRFCRHRPDYNGHVTFFSLEVWQDLLARLPRPVHGGPELVRRNVVVSGVDLKALYQQPFSIHDIQFIGATHCAPCLGMNRALGPGARNALQGRGGLRARLLSSGRLPTGPASLQTDARFDPANAASQPPPAPLP